MPAFGGGVGFGLATVAFRVGSRTGVGADAGARVRLGGAGVYESLDIILVGWASIPELCVDDAEGFSAAAAFMPELGVEKGSAESGERGGLYWAVRIPELRVEKDSKPRSEGIYVILG